MRSASSITAVIDERLFLVACLLSCGIWVSVAAYQLTHYRDVTETMRKHHVPFPSLSYPLAIVAELSGAVMVGSGRAVTFGAAIWLLFLLVTTPFYHGRIMRDGAIDLSQLVQLFKNVSIAGGLVALILIDRGRLAAPATPSPPAIDRVVR